MFTTPPPSKIVTRRQMREAAANEKRECAITSQPAVEPIVQPPVLGTDGKKPPMGLELLKVETVKTTPYMSVKSGSATSSKSKRSTSSSIAKRKKLELEAAEAKARIQIDLIDKKLELGLAQVDAEDSQSDCGSEHDQGSSRQADVEEWLNKSHVSSGAVPALRPTMNDAGQTAAVAGPITDNSVPLDSIQQLALTLKDMMKSSSAESGNNLANRLAMPRDLPCFSGDCVEWLHFKSAYEESTSVCNFTDTENLWRLRKALRGEAKEAVTDLLIGNTPPAAVMEALELRFGRAETIVLNLTTQIKRLPALPTAYQYDLINLSIKINNCVATIRALNQHDYIRSPELASAVLTKLPSTLLGKWTEYAYKRLTEDTPKLELLAAFLKHEAEMLSVVGLPQMRENKKFEHNNNPRTNRPIFATTAVEDKKCKFCAKSEHSLTDCRVFKRAMRRDKWKFVKTNGLCYCCLTARHDRNMCPAPVCDIDQCGLAHHRILHWKKPTSSSQSADQSDDKPIQPDEPQVTAQPTTGIEPHTMAHPNKHLG